MEELHQFLRKVSDISLGQDRVDDPTPEIELEQLTNAVSQYPMLKDIISFLQGQELVLVPKAREDKKVAPISKLLFTREPELYPASKLDQMHQEIEIMKKEMGFLNRQINIKEQQIDFNQKQMIKSAHSIDVIPDTMTKEIEKMQGNLKATHVKLREQTTQFALDLNSQKLSDPQEIQEPAETVQ